MALQQGLNCLSIPAAADLSASQFCLVAIDTAGRIALPSAGGDCVGVLQDKPDAIDKAGEVAMLNASLRVRIIASATIAAGAKLKADAAGKVLTATTGTHVVGTAFKAAVSGDLCEVLPSSRMLLP